MFLARHWEIEVACVHDPKCLSEQPIIWSPTGLNSEEPYPTQYDAQPKT